MAKQTFINLSEEKKKTITLAAKKEFSRVPLKDALVSNIVKDAAIPRGSFYQYFDNLEDFAIVWDEGGNAGKLYEYYFQDKNGNFSILDTFLLNLLNDFH